MEMVNLALVAGYISMLYKFLGFSVVIVNIYLFMIPAFVFILSDKLPIGKAILPSHQSTTITTAKANKHDK
jgi:hypothetical protein